MKDRLGFIITIVLLVVLCSIDVQTATTSKTKELIPNISIDNYGDVHFIKVEHYLSEEILSNVTKAAVAVEVSRSVLQKRSKIKNVRQSFLHSDPFGSIYQIEELSRTTKSLILNNNKEGKLPPLKMDLVFDMKNPNSQNATKYLDIVNPISRMLNSQDNLVSYCVDRAASNLLSNQITLEKLASKYGTYSTQYLKSKFTYEVSKNAYEKQVATYNPTVKRFNNALDKIKKLIQEKQDFIKKQRK